MASRAKPFGKTLSKRAFAASACWIIVASLPQVAPYHERHGPQCGEPDRRSGAGSGESGQERAPGAMAMGTDGMGMMFEMEMPLPDNTLPMMTGFGQFGPIEMGGMFTVMNVREGLAANDYKDPGPYKNSNPEPSPMKSMSRRSARQRGSQAKGLRE